MMELEYTILSEVNQAQKKTCPLPCGSLHLFLCVCIPSQSEPMESPGNQGGPYMGEGAILRQRGREEQNMCRENEREIIEGLEGMEPGR